MPNDIRVGGSSATQRRTTSPAAPSFRDQHIGHVDKNRALFAKEPLGKLDGYDTRDAAEDAGLEATRAADSVAAVFQKDGRFYLYRVESKWIGSLDDLNPSDTQPYGLSNRLNFDRPFSIKLTHPDIVSVVDGGMNANRRDNLEFQTIARAPGREYPYDAVQGEPYVKRRPPLPPDRNLPFDYEAWNRLVHQLERIPGVQRVSSSGPSMRVIFDANIDPAQLRAQVDRLNPIYEFVEAKEPHANVDDGSGSYGRAPQRSLLYRLPHGVPNPVPESKTVPVSELTAPNQGLGALRRIFDIF